jgi:hypothetical protein
VMADSRTADTMSEELQRAIAELRDQPRQSASVRAACNMALAGSTEALRTVLQFLTGRAEVP